MCCRAEKRVGSKCPPYGERCFLLFEGSLKTRGQQTMLSVSVAETFAKSSSLAHFFAMRFSNA